jgi:adenosylcobinamide kinase/adenosylcobinamide-phosphate guanylyltransferase
MWIFISGGCKNGKSTFAQNLAAGVARRGPLYYIATMNPKDDEDVRRIANHREERANMGFITIEQPTCIQAILEKCDHGGSFLLDSLTALLANEMFSASGNFDGNAYGRVAAGLSLILEKIQNIVIVSDFIYSDAMLYDPLTEEYRKSLAALDRLAAARCDAVLEAAFTQIITHKGSITHAIS